MRVREVASCDLYRRLINIKRERNSSCSCVSARRKRDDGIDFVIDAFMSDFNKSNLLPLSLPLPTSSAALMDQDIS